VRADKRPLDDGMVPAGEDREPVETYLAGVARASQVAAEVAGPQIAGPGQAADAGGDRFPGRGRGRNGSGRGA
jgi:hypothetical protein